MNVRRPAAGQILVEVAASSFNPIDASIRAGYLQQAFPLQLPHIPGIDVAGTIPECGDGVTGFRMGQRVPGFLPMDADSANAEYVVAPAEVLTAAPSSIPLTDAAALPAAALTAWQSLLEHAGLQAGQRILINSAGGGVGGFAVQLAKQAGAHVLATASPRSHDAVVQAGADHIIDYTRSKLADAVGDPVDVVLSLVAGPEADITALLDLIRPGGILVTTATGAQPDPPRNIRSTAVFVRSDAAQLAALVA